MQPQPIECVGKDKSHAIAHQAFSGEFSKRVIAQESAAQGPADNVVNINYSDKALALPMNDQKPSMSLGICLSYIFKITFARARR
jgi:hypothetical protein